MAGPSVRLHPDAIAEAKAAYEWYAERNPAAANAFIMEYGVSMEYGVRVIFYLFSVEVIIAEVASRN